MDNQTVCRLHDALRAAVVLLQLEHAAALEFLFETEHIVDVRPTEGIDALCVVAHGAYALVHRSELAHYLLLHGVRVLILVHEDILEVR